MITDTERQAAFISVGLIHKICGLRKRLTELFPDAEINQVTRKQIVERTLGKKLMENCEYFSRVRNGLYSVNLPEAQTICIAISRFNDQITIESTRHIYFGRTQFNVINQTLHTILNSPSENDNYENIIH